MSSMGDLASSVGKDFGQLSDAVIAARTLEFEQLKAFGILAKKEGDKVALTFKGQTKVIDASGDAVTDYVLSLGKLQGVQGSMAAISKTTGGQLSNLSDKFTQLKLEIGEKLKPVISAVIDAMSRMVDKLRSFVSWIQANQKEIGFWLGLLAKVTGAILSLIAAVRLFSFVVTVVKGITMAFSGLVTILNAVRAAMVIFNAVMLANPIGMIIAAVAALIGGLWGLGKLFPKIGEAISGFYKGVVKWFGLAWDWVNNNFIKPVFDKLRSIGEFFGIISEAKIDPIKTKSIDALKQTTAELKELNIGENVKAFIPSSSAYNPQKKNTNEKTNKRNLVNSQSPPKTKGLSQVVASKGSVNNTVIKIKSLVENMNFHYSGATKERASDVKREMEKVMIKLVNNVNHAT